MKIYLQHDASWKAKKESRARNVKDMPSFVQIDSLRKVRDGLKMKTKIRPSFPSVNKNRTNVLR